MMSAKLGVTLRPPVNMIAGESARVRVVATTISTWLVPGAVAETGSRKPCGSAAGETKNRHGNGQPVTALPQACLPWRWHETTHGPLD